MRNSFELIYIVVHIFETLLLNITELATMVSQSWSPNCVLRPLIKSSKEFKMRLFSLLILLPILTLYLRRRNDEPNLFSIFDKSFRFILEGDFYSSEKTLQILPISIKFWGLFTFLSPLLLLLIKILKNIVKFLQIDYEKKIFFFWYIFVYISLANNFRESIFII